jgi:type II secretion system protein C
LNLTLRGILSVEEDPTAPNGSVIIESTRGEMKTYYVGQGIDGADGATLHSVYADRVLLNRGGRLETLRLPKELTASPGSPLPMAAPLPQPAPAPLRDVITENATRLADIIRPSPHVQEGRVVGFRVNPGRDRAAFEALGLQPGDVVTDINGTILDDPSQGLAVFQALGESTQANVTVLRDGVPQVIVIDTTLLQRLQENRELTQRKRAEEARAARGRLCLCARPPCVRRSGLPLRAARRTRSKSCSTRRTTATPTSGWSSSRSNKSSAGRSSSIHAFARS